MRGRNTLINSRERKVLDSGLLKNDPEREGEGKHETVKPEGLEVSLHVETGKGENAGGNGEKLKSKVRGWKGGWARGERSEVRVS